MKTSDKRLAIFFPNWLGDGIMALPAVYGLREAGFSLEIFGRSWMLDLLRDSSFPLKALPKEIGKAAGVLSGANAGQVLIFPNSISSALKARLAGLKAFGYRVDARRWILNGGIKKPKGLHEVEYFWNLAQYFTTKIAEEEWKYPFPSNIQVSLASAQLKHAKELLLREKIQNPYWVLCPMAIDGEKVWPHWRQLAENLKNRGISLVVCPGPGERPQCEFLMPYANFFEVNLYDYAGILALSDEVIANDTGPMHLADAVGAKVLGIFGHSDPRRTRPWGGHYLGEKGRWPTVAEVVDFLFPKS